MRSLWAPNKHANVPDLAGKVTSSANLQNVLSPEKETCSADNQVTHNDRRRIQAEQLMDFRKDGTLESPSCSTSGTPINTPDSIIQEYISLEGSTLGTSSREFTTLAFYAGNVDYCHLRL